MRLLLSLLILAIFLPRAGWGEGIAEGPHANDACIDCHRTENPELVAAWEQSPHGTTTDCVACHGAYHAALKMARARKNAACDGCHGGPESHSYAVSKHGVIAALEGDRWDWRQPLSDGNYRAPTCAYCHMHQGEHGSLGEPEAPCLECHSPRLTSTWFSSGKRMVAIGAMKVREAEGVLAQEGWAPVMREKAEARLKKMAGEHLRNVRLGLGHQSPDYQWWRGHPALDGDLLRIKGFYGRARRQ